MAKNRMVRLTDYNKLYDSIAEAKIINADLLDVVDTDELIGKIFQKTQGSLEWAPRCKCGRTVGKQFEGQQCDGCGTVVSSSFANQFQPINWMRIPEGMPKFLHPIFYLILSNFAGRIRVGNKGTKDAGKKQKVSIIDFILNIDETLPEDIAIGVHGQGFIYFIDHMEEILHFLFLEHPRYSKSPRAKQIWALYEKYKDCLVLDKFPILHPSFHPIHIEGRTKSVDKTADIILAAVINLFNAEYSINRCVTKSRYKDKIMWKIYQKYIQYVKEIIELKIGDKHALVRRHCVAARVHFSLRGVIVPIIDSHEGDEIYLPWAIALQNLKFEIFGRLVKAYNMTPTAAGDKFMTAFKMFDQDIYDIMMQLMKECPYKGFPVALGRNPTLLKENIRLLFATKIKRNIADNSISIPPPICGGFNAKSHWPLRK